MAQYQVGTVSVIQGTNIVTGVGTSWLSKVSVGDTFKVYGVAAIYGVISVDSNTQIKISPNYAGISVAGSSYQITTDWTPNLGLAEIHAGDSEFAFHLTQEVIRKIDARIGQSGILVGEAATQAQEDALFAQGYTFVIRTDLLGTTTTSPSTTTLAATTTVSPTTTTVAPITTVTATTAMPTTTSAATTTAMPTTTSAATTTSVPTTVTPTTTVGATTVGATTTVGPTTTSGPTTTVSPTTTTVQVTTTAAPTTTVAATTTTSVPALTVTDDFTDLSKWDIANPVVFTGAVSSVSITRATDFDVTNGAIKIAWVGAAETLAYVPMLNAVDWSAGKKVQMRANWITLNSNASPQEQQISIIDATNPARWVRIGVGDEGSNYSWYATSEGVAGYAINTPTVSGTLIKLVRASSTTWSVYRSADEGSTWSIMQGNMAVPSGFGNSVKVGVGSWNQNSHTFTNLQFSDLLVGAN